MKGKQKSWRRLDNKLCDPRNKEKSQNDTNVGPGSNSYMI